MSDIQPDHRSQKRREADDQIAAEPPVPIPEIDPGSLPRPLEIHLARMMKSSAIEGVVEDGVVKFSDPGVELPEQTRVVVIAPPKFE